MIWLIAAVMGVLSGAILLGDGANEGLIVGLVLTPFLVGGPLELPVIPIAVYVAMTVYAAAYERWPRT